MKKRNILLMTCGLLTISSCSLDSLAKFSNATSANVWGAEGRVDNKAVEEVLGSLNLDGDSEEKNLISKTKQLFRDLNDAAENNANNNNFEQVNFEKVIKTLGRDDIFEKVRTLDDHSIEELGKQLDKEVVVEPSTISALINAIDDELGISKILAVDEESPLELKMIINVFKDVVNVLTTKGITQRDVVALSVVSSAVISMENKLTSDSALVVINAITIADKLNSSLVDCLISSLMQNFNIGDLRDKS